VNVISCGLSLGLGLHLSQGAGFYQACLMFARCLLDRVNGVLVSLKTRNVYGRRNGLNAARVKQSLPDNDKNLM